MNIEHNDLPPNCGQTTDSAFECHKKCINTPYCRAFTWIDKKRNDHNSNFDNKCCLKTDLGKLIPWKGAVSGSAFCGKFGGKYLKQQILCSITF